AEVGSSADIDVTGNATVKSDAQVNANAEVLTVTGGIGSTGASISRANITTTAAAKIASLVVLTAGAALIIQSLFNHNGPSGTGRKTRSVANAPSASVGLSTHGTFATAHNSGSSEAS